MSTNFSSETAIVGIGATEFSKDSGRTPMELAVEACEAALKDAGVTALDVDGIVTFSSEQNFEIEKMLCFSDFLLSRPFGRFCRDQHGGCPDRLHFRRGRVQGP